MSQKKKTVLQPVDVCITLCCLLSDMFSKNDPEVSGSGRGGGITDLLGPIFIHLDETKPKISYNITIIKKTYKNRVAT